MKPEEATQALYAVKDELIERHFEFKGHVSAPITAIDMAIEALEQSQWIPFSEKPPKLYQKIFFTEFKFENGFDTFVGSGMYLGQDSDKSLFVGDKPENSWNVHDTKHISGRKWHVTSSYVAAWMPFPDAYDGNDPVSDRCRELAGE